MQDRDRETPNSGPRLFGHFWRFLDLLEIHRCLFSLFFCSLLFGRSATGLSIVLYIWNQLLFRSTTVNSIVKNDRNVFIYDAFLHLNLSPCQHGCRFSVCHVWKMTVTDDRFGISLSVCRAVLFFCEHKVPRKRGDLTAHAVRSCNIQRISVAV